MTVKASRKSTPKVTKEELLSRVGKKEGQEHLLASLEYMFDMVLDMNIKMMDSLIANNNLTLTVEEQESYDKLKAMQEQLHTFDLGNPLFPDGRGTNVLDYIYGLKGSIMKERAKYFRLKDKLGI